MRNEPPHPLRSGSDRHCRRVLGRIRHGAAGAAVVDAIAFALICGAPVVVAFFVLAVLGPVAMASKDAEREREAAEMGIIRK